MKKLVTRSITFGLLLLFLLQAVALAAAAPSKIQKIRISQAADKIRIVLDLSTLPVYSVDAATAGQITVDLPNVAAASDLVLPAVKDEAVEAVRLDKIDENRQQLVITLKTLVSSRVFTLAGPNRLVIDLVKNYDHKIVTTVAPGLVYTDWLRTQSFGPVSAYILDVDLTKYTLKPVLSNGAIQGLESVEDMAEHNQAIAAVNGSYFASNGEIIGLLKLNNTIASIPYITRTALGITAGNGVIFDQIAYQGSIRLPDKRVLAINGINCERSEDAVTLYNPYYGTSTGTNEFGREYVVTNGKITAISPKNTKLIGGSVVLSAHGAAAKAMESLKIGDLITIEQSLGDAFDKVPFAVGAGPMLVKDGNVFLTTKTEEFPSDIAVGRAPRTAVGITKGGHLLLVVIDGRQTMSKGVSLVELAGFMQELGAVQAMNFDGGGSSEMVLKDKVVNKPSDGQERLVGDALIIVPKK